MRIAFTSIKSIGGTFMDWSFGYLTGKVPVVDNPMGGNGNNAHGHNMKNGMVHPIWNHPRGNRVKEWLNDNKDYKGIKTFYPFVNGNFAMGDLFYDLNKEMIEYLLEQDVKVFLLQPTTPYPYLGARFWKDEDHIDFFQRYLKTDSTSFKKIRELASFRVIANAKKSVEDADKFHSKMNSKVSGSFTDKDWQTKPEDCIKSICDTLGVEILSDRLEQWRPITEKWTGNMARVNKWYQQDINEITTAIVENNPMALPKLDLMGQITIMAHLMKDHGKRLILPTDEFPLDSQHLNGYIK